MPARKAPNGLPALVVALSLVLARVTSGSPLPELAQALGQGGEFVIWLAVAAAGIVLATWVFAQVLRLQVRSRTRALRQSEQKYRRLFADLSDAALLVDPTTGIIAESNRAASVLLGRERDAIIGSSHGKVFAPDRRERCLSRLAECAAAEGPVSMPCEAVRADGTVVPVVANASLIPLAGQPMMLCLLRDVTELRRARQTAERRAREAEALHDLAQQVGASLSPDEVVRAALSGLAQAAQTDLVLLFLARGTELSLRGCHPETALGGEPVSGDIALAGELCGEAVDAGAEGGGDAARFWLDVRADARYPHTDPRPPAIRSFAALPLSSGSEVLGACGLAARSERDFAAEKEFLETLVRQVAAALQNALLYERAREQAEELRERIAEQARAETDLRASERRFRGLFQESPIGVLVCAADGTVLNANEASLRIFGVSDRRELADFRATDDPNVPADLAEALRTGEAVEREVEYDFEAVRARGVHNPTRSGTACLQIQVTPLAPRDPGGLRTFVVQVQDTSERRRARDEAEWLARFPNENPSPVLRISREGVVLYGNRASRPLLEAWLRGGQPVLPEPWNGRVREALKSGRSRVFETLCEGRVIALVLSPMADEGYVNVYGHDVTERHRAQQELQQKQELLDRAARLESVGKLAGGIAHDFNNLLTGIIGYSDLLLRALPEDDPNSGDIAQIRQAAERAADLTQQLLAFSRKQVLAPEVVDLNETVLRMGSLLRRLIGENVHLSTDLAPDLAMTELDPTQIEQVIMNLAVNARDAMPAGGHLVIETANVVLDEEFVQTHVGSKPGAHVALTVTDDGVGMDEETRARIFEPFFTTKERGEGTGLGLATTYGIVKQHGGSIWAESTPGEGTTFRIFLPVARTAAGAVPRPRARAAARGGSEFILLVEDEEAVRRLAARVLMQAGYRVHAAGSAGEAELAAEEHGDELTLMITDVVLPDKSGPALYEGLAPMLRDLRVLYMSGYTDRAIVQHGVLRPDVAFLQKPFAPDELLSKTREVLDSGKMTGVTGGAD